MLELDKVIAPPVACTERAKVSEPVVVYPGRYAVAVAAPSTASLPLIDGTVVEIVGPTALP